MTFQEKIQSVNFFTASDPEGGDHGLWLTTDHPASSYNQPVIVDDETGQAYGTADLAGWRIWSGHQEGAEKALKAGYRQFRPLTKDVA